MLGQVVPYCGLPPVPAELLQRFNLDPLLVLVLAGCATAHLLRIPRSDSRTPAAIGWMIAAIAFMSPLCALSVSLFSARVAQHMILILAAAPLVFLATFLFNSEVEKLVFPNANVRAGHSAAEATTPIVDLQLDEFPITDLLRAAITTTNKPEIVSTTPAGSGVAAPPICSFMRDASRACPTAVGCSSSQNR